MTAPPRWRRSTRSVNGSSCVELAHTRDAIRDSKNPTATLTVPTSTLVDSAKRITASSLLTL
jgi:Domain of unknown function (DUF397)